MHLTKILHGKILLQNIGKCSYTPAMEIMKNYEQHKKLYLRKEITNEPVDRLLICEHNPVYTIGKRKQDYNDQSMIERLKSLNAEFHSTDRGGLITFHGPGQLVCYPILNLKHYKPSVKWYICHLEQVIINTLEDFNIKAERTNDVGIWIGNNKIAAIGIHCRQYITTHGLALNCNTDLSWFNHIVPCGLVGKGVTSITNETNQEITIERVLPVFIKCFEQVFNSEIYHEN